jgi:hypothetical protein
VEGVAFHRNGSTSSLSQTAGSLIDAKVPTVCVYPGPLLFFGVRCYVREVRGLVLGASKHRVGCLTI